MKFSKKDNYWKQFKGLDIDNMSDEEFKSSINKIKRTALLLKVSGSFLFIGSILLLIVCLVCCN